MIEELKDYKILVLMEQDWDSSIVVGTILVPVDFDDQKVHSEWLNENLKPFKGRNQYGEWESKKIFHPDPKKAYRDWLREKYPSVAFHESIW